MTQRTRSVVLPVMVCMSTLIETGRGLAEDTGTPSASSEIKPAVKPGEELIFADILAKYENLTYEQLQADHKPRQYVEQLPFDPPVVKYFEQATAKLQLNQQEQEIFKRHGFVSVDRGQRYSFGSAYFAIYTYDLPVLITTDSILHALHRSYDQILQELELTLFSTTIGEVLSKGHETLAQLAQGNTDAELSNQYRDVDVYLTVARNLLAGAGADPSEKDLQGAVFESDQQPYWDNKLLVPSKLGQDAKALELLLAIQSLTLQETEIYGGVRNIDFTQFRPRGHYTKSMMLRRYFRTLMWLGRVDCGWNILPPDPQSGIKADADRELRDAVLLSEIFDKSESVKPLKAMDDIINFLVGKSDNLSVFTLLQLMQAQKITMLSELSNPTVLSALKQAVASGKYSEQRIRSQFVVSDSRSPDKVSPPPVFQLFGQRFVIDSFVLSQVVSDAIIYQGRKMPRFMPTGLDVMAALGNDEAISLLADELTKYQYSANLKSTQVFISLLQPGFWRESLYNLWLGALRALDDALSQQQNFPQVMRTRMWQRKQLQTQLGSWAELRHDTILYAKQSYTASLVCEYPTGYVEPYPQFYAQVRYFAEEAARLLGGADFLASNVAKLGELTSVKDRQVAFLKKMAERLGQLEALAEKELAAQPFTQEEQAFLKKTIDIRGGGSGPPTYSGWYGDLFYVPHGLGGMEAAKWDPTVADVHTDANSGSVLEVAVGDVNFIVAAIDNQNDRLVYVGPVFSYYEFQQPMTKRLTDQEWQQMITNNQLPSRPEWIAPFQGPRQQRN
ncbi:MAG: DUF3160 domain-containing protein [Deltaproteobacteria bacterium]|nr:DUF3160 domain-containing protein [Deltaproteobacteria bacterium]